MDAFFVEDDDFRIGFGATSVPGKGFTAGLAEGSIEDLKVTLFLSGVFAVKSTAGTSATRGFPETLGVTTFLAEAFPARSSAERP